MYFNTVDVLNFILGRFSTGNDRNIMTMIKQCLSQIIGTQGTAFEGRIEMLMKDHNFHDAKKTNPIGADESCRKEKKKGRG
jgi:hypothetical protein